MGRKARYSTEQGYPEKQVAAQSGPCREPQSQCHDRTLGGENRQPIISVSSTSAKSLPANLARLSEIGRRRLLQRAIALSRTAG